MWTLALTTPPLLAAAGEDDPERWLTYKELRGGQASERARLVKLADKICNLRDILSSTPAGWSLARRQRYFDWAKEVLDQARGVNPRLERMFDRLYRQRPVGDGRGATRRGKPAGQLD